jgi:hypothetical protein
MMKMSTADKKHIRESRIGSFKTWAHDLYTSNLLTYLESPYIPLGKQSAERVWTRKEERKAMLAEFKKRFGYPYSEAVVKLGPISGLATREYSVTRMVKKRVK